MAGRPSKYKTEYAEQAYKYCLLGADDKRLADLFEVQESTINYWKQAHKEFLESIKKGKDIADAEVAASLYKRATGYKIDTVKVFQFQGEPVVVPVTEEIAPDTGAAMAWLKNRQSSKWRDKQEIESTATNHNINESIDHLTDEEKRKKLDEYTSRVYGIPIEKLRK